MPAESRARVLRAASAALSALWPLAVLAGLALGALSWVLVLGLVLFGVRAAMELRSGRRGVSAAAVTGAGAAVCAAGLLFARDAAALWYPVIVNAVLFFVFSSSLIRGVPVAERFARLASGKPLPAAAVRYCRRVTLVWCFFFVLNGAVALLTVLSGSLRWWGLWNGCLSYLFMGALMASEYLVRRRLQHAAAVQ